MNAIKSRDERALYLLALTVCVNIKNLVDHEKLSQNAS